MCWQGGDWDRRNRLKIYEAMYLITNRSFKKAADLLLDCIATFTCVELTSYNQVRAAATDWQGVRREPVENDQIII